MKRYLLVTGDDYGYSAERNRGVAECFVRGAITRASLLVNGFATKQAVWLAQSLHLPLGLHMNLTEGSPVSPAADVCTLLDHNGCFLGKMGFREQLKLGMLSLSQVEDEMMAQVTLFQTMMGSLPLFIDGHQHLHILPGIRDVFAKVLHSFNITMTRLPLEPLIASCHWIEEPRRSFYNDVVMNSQESRAVFDQHGIRYTHTFIGMSTQGADMTPHRLCSRLYSALMLAEEKDESSDTSARELHHPCKGASGEPGDHGIGNPVSKLLLTDEVCDSIYQLPYHSQLDRADISDTNLRRTSHEGTVICDIENGKTGKNWSNSKLRCYKCENGSEQQFKQVVGVGGQGAYQPSMREDAQPSLDPLNKRWSDHPENAVHTSVNHDVARGSDVMLSPVVEKNTEVSSPWEAPQADIDIVGNRHQMTNRSSSLEIDGTDCSKLELRRSLSRDDIHSVHESNHQTLNGSLPTCIHSSSQPVKRNCHFSSGYSHSMRSSAKWVACELMAHPGYPCTSPDGGCGVGPDDFARSSERQHEMDILTCLMLQNFYKQHHIQLVSSLPDL